MLCNKFGVCHPLKKNIYVFTIKFGVCHPLKKKRKKKKRKKEKEKKRGKEEKGKKISIFILI
jgi:folate-dependent tRNA-U54 methylase TrmFO/GidA